MLCFRLGPELKKGAWDSDEVQRLETAVRQYLDARTAAEEADVDLESYDPSQYDWDAFLTQ